MAAALKTKGARFVRPSATNVTLSTTLAAFFEAYAGVTAAVSVLGAFCAFFLLCANNNPVPEVSLTLVRKFLELSCHGYFTQQGENKGNASNDLHLLLFVLCET